MTGIELRPLGTPDLQLDQIFYNGHRIGFLPTTEGAVARFVRDLSAEEGQAVHANLATLRRDRGQPGISPLTIQPPSAEQLEQFADEEDDEDDDE